MRFRPFQSSIAWIIRDLINETHPMGFIRLQYPSAQAKVFGVRPSNSFGKNKRRHGRKNAENDLRLTEHGIFGRKDTMAKAYQLEASTETLSSHRGHEKDLAVRHDSEELMESGEHSAHLFRQMLWYAGTEGKVLAFAFHTDRTELAGLFGFVKDIGQALHHRHIDDVALGAS